MEFYRIYIGLAANHMSKGDNNTEADLLEIPYLSETFYYRSEENCYIYLQPKRKDVLYLIGIFRNPLLAKDNIKEFIEYIGIEMSSFSIEELTYKELCMRINRSLDCADEVLQRFGLENINTYRQLNYSEKFIRKSAQLDDLTANAKANMYGDTLIPELNRIFHGRKKEYTYGNHVHYILTVNDKTLRDKINSDLLSALY